MDEQIFVKAFGNHTPNSDGVNLHILQTLDRYGESNMFQLCRHMKVSDGGSKRSSAREVLEGFAALGIVLKAERFMLNQSAGHQRGALGEHPTGRTCTTYRLNLEHPLAAPLRALFNEAVKT